MRKILLVKLMYRKTFVGYIMSINRNTIDVLYFFSTIQYKQNKFIAR